MSITINRVRVNKKNQEQLKTLLGNKFKGFTTIDNKLYVLMEQYNSITQIEEGSLILEDKNNRFSVSK